jgi:RNA polymerase sigma-70 factor, ECF subfamily
MDPVPLDAELVRRVIGRDATAVEELYEAHVDGLYAFVFYRVGRDAAMAEDVVQETFMAALGRLDEYDAARGALRGWLCTLSRNIIRRHLAHHPRTRELDARWQRIDATLGELFAALDGAPLSDELVARQETRDLVSMTVANLPEHYRSVLEQKYVGGRTLEEMAGELELSVDAIKSLLARARRAFRETFSTLSREVAESGAR